MTDTFVPSFPSVFDSSIMATFKSCARKFELEYLNHWKPKTPSVHLHAGGAFARGLEVARDSFYVQGQSAEDAVALGLAALIAYYGDFECPADSAKSLERMCGAFEFYFQHYPLMEGVDEPITLPSGRRGIEFSFANPLPVDHPETGEPIIYCGRLDAILNFAGGVYLCDEKTTSQLGASWSRQWDLRSQFTGYAWGCREMGIRVDGALVRGISILKTKYDTQQAISYRPEWHVDRWLSETCDWIEDAIRMWKKKYWRHNLDHSCAEYGGCSMRQICLTQDPQPWLETYFERRVWDPIARTENLVGGRAVAQDNSLPAGIVVDV